MMGRVGQFCLARSAARSKVCMMKRIALIAVLLSTLQIAVGQAQISEYVDSELGRLSQNRPTKFASSAEWQARRDLVMNRLRSETFQAWPKATGKLNRSNEFAESKDGIVLSRYLFRSEGPIQLPLFVIHRDGLKAPDLDLVVLNVLDDEDWEVFTGRFGPAFPKAFQGVKLPEHDRKNYDSEVRMHRNMKWGMAYVPPRGVGPTSVSKDFSSELTLLGQTLDSAQIWDIRRGIQALRSIDGMEEPNLWLQSSRTMAANTLYASLFEKGIHRMDLHELPATHWGGPVLPGVLRFTDIPEIGAMAAERARLTIYTGEKEAWSQLAEVGELLGWKNRVQLRKPLE
tara:strand:- start:277 stop:1305 length:1029 start_codon:yes stop_codon:yes gene_type:complete